MFHERQIEHHVLRVLARQPDHGYRIAQAIKSRAKGLLDGQESLLYPSLYSLENQGLIESYMQSEGDTTYRHYRLTDKGRGIVERIEKKSERKSEVTNLVPDQGASNG